MAIPIHTLSSTFEFKKFTTYLQHRLSMKTMLFHLHISPHTNLPLLLYVDSINRLCSNINSTSIHAPSIHGKTCQLLIFFPRVLLSMPSVSNFWYWLAEDDGYDNSSHTMTMDIIAIDTICRNHINQGQPHLLFTKCLIHQDRVWYHQPYDFYFLKNNRGETSLIARMICIQQPWSAISGYLST
ncbi:hypothetical protein BDB01DRAFT_897536 [Pilobolus umbonatus]|nr:hypothetical protein BDB01DRAFT_897536 [Pilobolus umbonatus]